MDKSRRSQSIPASLSKRTQTQFAVPALNGKGPLPVQPGLNRINVAPQRVIKNDAPRPPRPAAILVRASYPPVVAARTVQAHQGRQPQPYPPVYRPGMNGLATNLAYRGGAALRAAPALGQHGIEGSMSVRPVFHLGLPPISSGSARPGLQPHVLPIQPKATHLRVPSPWPSPPVVLRKLAQAKGPSHPRRNQAPPTLMASHVIQGLMLGSYVEVDRGGAAWFGEIVEMGRTGVHQVRVGGTTDSIVPVAVDRLTDTSILYFPATVRTCIDKGKERARIVAGSIKDTHKARFESAYETSLLKGGSITSNFKARTEHGEYENIPDARGHFVISKTYVSPEEDQRPSPGVALSEIVYRQMTKSTQDIRYDWDSDLRWTWNKTINVSHIANPIAKEVIKYITSRIDMRRSSVQQEPINGYQGFRCSRPQWEFYALLGTPSCTAPAMLIKDHGTDLGISRITTIECEFRGMLWIHFA